MFMLRVRLELQKQFPFFAVKNRVNCKALLQCFLKWYMNFTVETQWKRTNCVTSPPPLVTMSTPSGKGTEIDVMQHQQVFRLLVFLSKHCVNEQLAAASVNVSCSSFVLVLLIREGLYKSQIPETATIIFFSVKIFPYPPVTPSNHLVSFMASFPAKFCPHLHDTLHCLPFLYAAGESCLESYNAVRNDLLRKWMRVNFVIHHVQQTFTVIIMKLKWRLPVTLLSVASESDKRVFSCVFKHLRS